MYPIISLSKGLEIPTFFLVISLVLSISLFWIVRRSEQYHLPKKNILDLSLLLMVAAFVGARLMHIFFENFDYYRQDPVKMLYFWDGGFVFYGGMIVAFAAAFLYFKLTRVSDRGLYFDAFAPVLSFAYGFGRLGCFFAGCCFGKECDYFWAIQHRHPTQLYALFWEVGAICLLLGIERTSQKSPRPRRPHALRHPGALFLLWLGLHAIGRLLMETFRDDFRGPLLLGLSVSTVLSLLLLFSVIIIAIPKR